MNAFPPGHMLADRTTLQELAYWRRSFIRQRRKWGHLKWWHHPYQAAREQLQKKVKLP